MEQPPLPTKFLIKNNNYIPVKDFVLDDYYFLEEVVIEFYYQYDYLLKVSEVTDTSVTFKRVFYRVNESMIEPGSWVEDEDGYTYMKEDIEKGYTENGNELRFYKAAPNP